MKNKDLIKKVNDIKTLQETNNNNINNLNTKVNEYKTQVQELQTTYEQAFQRGVEAKNKLVDALNSINVTCSTSISFTNLTDKISKLASPSYQLYGGLTCSTTRPSKANKGDIWVNENLNISNLKFTNDITQETGNTNTFYITFLNDIINIDYDDFVKSITNLEPVKYSFTQESLVDSIPETFLPVLFTNYNTYYILPIALFKYDGSNFVQMKASWYNGSSWVDLQYRVDAYFYITSTSTILSKKLDGNTYISFNNNLDQWDMFLSRVISGNDQHLYCNRTSNTSVRYNFVSTNGSIHNYYTRNLTLNSTKPPNMCYVPNVGYFALSDNSHAGSVKVNKFGLDGSFVLNRTITATSASIKNSITYFNGMLVLYCTNDPIDEYMTFLDYNLNILGVTSRTYGAEEFLFLGTDMYKIEYTNPLYITKYSYCNNYDFELVTKYTDTNCGNTYGTSTIVYNKSNDTPYIACMYNANTGDNMVIDLINLKTFSWEYREEDSQNSITYRSRSCAYPNGDIIFNSHSNFYDEPNKIMKFNIYDKSLTEIFTNTEGTVGLLGSSLPLYNEDPSIYQ